MLMVKCQNLKMEISKLHLVPLNLYMAKKFVMFYDIITGLVSIVCMEQCYVMLACLIHFAEGNVCIEINSF